MRSISFLFVFIFVVPVYSMPVFYDTTTLNVDSWGHIDTDKYLSDYPNLDVVYVKDGDAILKNNRTHIRYDKTTKNIVLKTWFQIDSLKNDERRQKIRNEIRILKRQEMEALSDGFEVSIETETIKQKVESLKQDYLSIPGLISK